MENKVISHYSKDIETSGLKLKAELKTYEKPIHKTGPQVYTRLELYEGSVLWGNMNWAAEEITEQTAEEIFNDVIKQPNTYKSK
ncbi:MAG: hypothetical protein WC055_11995 [Melioribacteraceae bacterium]